MERINRLAQTPMTEENCFVFPNLMIDNLPTSYYSIIQPPLLNTFLEDTQKGISLLLVHNNRKLPVGRSFDARIKEEYVASEGRTVLTLYGDFYIPSGINLEGGVSTDDIAKGIDTGINFATSIGFSAEKWDCSICGNDIRSYFECPHIPGRKYAVEKDGEDVVETCHVLVGSNGVGSLNEDSLVYAGACDRASVVANFSKSVTEFKNDPKLQVVEEFKNIPQDSTLYQYCSREGTSLYTSTSERTGGASYLKKRSEEQVELSKLTATLKEFGIVADSEDSLKTSLSEMATKNQELSKKVEDVEKGAQELQAKVEGLESELQEAKTSIETKDATIADLETTNHELSKKAEDAETYREDLTARALELGVKLQGNAFPKDTFSKFLATLPTDELKKVVNDYDKSVKDKFEGVKTSTTKEPQKSFSDKEPTSVDDFDSEDEFRNYIADKAVEYAKENGVSIREATSELMEKFKEVE